MNRMSSIVSSVSFASLASVASFSFVIATTVVTGCGGSASNGSTAVEESTSGTGSSGNANQAFCAAFCTGAATCDSTVDADTCKIKCEDNAGQTFNRESTAYTTSVISCVAEADCAHLLQSDFLQSCADTAAAETTPSAAAITLCKDFASAGTTCGETVNMAGCLESAKTFSDAINEQADGCTKKACGAMSDCIDAVWGVDDSSSSGN